jgi:two-component system LytT family response regulator
MRVVLVEDSRLARAEMRRLLAIETDVEIAGEAANADEAAALIEEFSPDLIFLDIQMPGRDGFNLLASLDRAPLVIFCTAYSEFAVRAFEQNALDYLLKPVEPSRLARALERARRTLETDRAGGAKRAQKLGLSDRVFVRDGEKCWFVLLKDVRLFEVERNYTRVYFGAERPLVLKTLNYLEARLDPAVFFRASRRHIVNLQWVNDVTTAVSGGLQLSLKGGQEVEVSRRQAQLFKEAMSL